MKSEKKMLMLSGYQWVVMSKERKNTLDYTVLGSEWKPGHWKWARMDIGERKACRTLVKNMCIRIDQILLQFAVILLTHLYQTFYLFPGLVFLNVLLSFYFSNTENGTNHLCAQAEHNHIDIAQNP